MHDLLIKNGNVIDGTGVPWYRADVALSGDKIVEIGLLEGAEAAETIDATGRFVTPGFIEEHGHSDVTVLVDPLSQSAIRQGMTTLVLGLCGMSAAPTAESIRDVYVQAAPLFNFEGYEWTWESVGEYLETISKAHTSVNVVALAGHMPIRLAVMGEASRPANESERREMRAMLANAADEGARGMSTGLTYGHTMFADTDEIVEMAKALQPYGWGYHTHMRDQGEQLLESVSEAIEISERAEVPLTISHLYPVRQENWGKAAPALELLEDARDRGLQVGFDVTPWLRGGGPLSQSLQGWVREGGHEAMLERLRDPELRIRIGQELEEIWDWDDLLICHVGNRDHLDWLGQSIADIAEERGIPAVECGPLLLAEDDANLNIAPEFKSDMDIDMLVKHPLGAVVADAFALSPEGPLAYQDRPNSYGTFPRVLGRYVRERGIITWEEAVQKMTSIPASRFGLWDRGVLKPGLMADLVVFNPETVIEKADYANPQEFPEGIDWVVVNGKVTVSPEGHTGAQAGRAL